MSLCPDKISYEQLECVVAPRTVHPIGRRFHRLRGKLTVSQRSVTVSTTRSQVKVYFIMADQVHKFLCWYYWEEGDFGGVWNDMFAMQVMDANADDSAPSNVKNEVVGVGGGPLPFSSEIDLDGFAAEGRTRASVGILAAGKDLFTAYFHDIDVDGPSPHFRLQFRGSPPQDLIHRDLQGHLFRLGWKKKFSLDDSWIPRF
jgi:hypothetical protein